MIIFLQWKIKVQWGRVFQSSTISRWRSPDAHPKNLMLTTIVKVLVYNLWSSVSWTFSHIHTYFRAIIHWSTNWHLEYFHSFTIVNLLYLHALIYFADWFLYVEFLGQRICMHFLNLNRYFDNAFQKLCATTV